MAIFKLLGCLMILSAGGLAAISAVKYERRRLTVLDGWIDLIFHIRSQIDCYLMPLNDILAGTDRDLLRACMGNGHCIDLDTLLKNSQFYLGNEARRLLSAFVREIGSSYREEQVKRCDYYMTALRGLREKQMQEFPAKTRVCVALCLCLAIGIAILLW